MRVTVLGTGNMGAGMARSLLREGHEVTVWNRTPSRAGTLADAGATVAPGLADAVADADVVLTALFDADSVVEVMEGITVPEGAVWLQTATVGVEGSDRLAALADARDLRLVDAPVLGTKGPAEQGALVVLVSGDEQAVRDARPAIDAIGQRVVVAGPDVGDASRLKLVCNAWVASLTAALGQSMALADGLGLDPRLFLEAIEGGPVDAPYAHLKGAAVLEQDWATSFAVDGVVKDVGLIRDAARATGTHDGLLTAVLERFVAASEAGHGDDDMAAVRTAF